eukprot:m.484203 g.484203  ORF g.484203 m.484203 type:complete len:261 (-) comp23245_c0_seq1:93-875(-)
MSDWEAWDEEEEEQPTAPVAAPATASADLTWEDDDEIEDDDDDETEAKPYEKMAVTELVSRCKLKDKELDRLQKQIKELKKKKTAKESEEEERELTPMEKLALKMKQQKQAEQQDLMMAADTFGIDAAEVQAQNEDLAATDFLDKFKPATRADYDQFAGAIVAKITPYMSGREYTNFVVTLSKALCDSVSVDDVRKVASALSLLANEKQKASKGKIKAKKSSKKATLGGGSMKAHVADAFEGMQASAALDAYEFGDDDFM